MSEAAAQRIDRWLWHARFFRSRSLATAAVKRGHVDVNGSPAKPSRLVVPGDTLAIRTEAGRRTVLLLACMPARVSATLAAELYRETPLSVAQNRAARDAPAPAGRPDKHARRVLTQFKRRRDAGERGPGAEPA